MEALAMFAAPLDMLWQVAALGMWFGLVHALDADHLATLGGLAANDRTASASAYAVKWALGHAAALAAAACAVLGFGFGGLAAVGGVAEWAVAGVLLALAAQSFVGVARLRAVRGGANDSSAEHTASERGALESGAAAAVAAGSRSYTGRSYRKGMRGWWLGVLHGGAGSAAVLALLPLAALDSLARSALYLACFSSGVAAGALAFAHGLAGILAKCRTKGRDPRLALALQGAAGVAAVLAGAWLVRELSTAADRLGGL